MKILIVEDEEINLALQSEVLAGYGETVGVSTGLQALAAIQEAYELGEPFDLVCLDIMMPGLDGQQTLKELRRREGDMGVTVDEQVKVIMLTGLGDSKNINEAYLEGRCQAYLTKPYTTVQLHQQFVNLGLVENG